MTASERKAAIDMDALESKTLDSLSASDFLAALASTGSVGVQALRIWPEKKKYELFVEPENLGKATLGGLFKGIREKKKIELEKDPRTEVFQKVNAAEFEFINPKDLVINPAFREAVTTIVREVAQLGR
jgi:hypothetical protein